jgi:hypothetical protein
MDNKDQQEEKKYPPRFNPFTARPSYGQYKVRNDTERKLESFLCQTNDNGSEECFKAQEKLWANSDSQVASNYSLNGSVPIPAKRPDLNRYDNIKPIDDEKQKATLMKSHHDPEMRENTEKRREAVCKGAQKQMQQCLKNNNPYGARQKYNSVAPYCDESAFTDLLAQLQLQEDRKKAKENT